MPMDLLEDVLTEMTSNESLSQHPGNFRHHATTLADENIGQLHLRTRLLYLIIAIFGALGNVASGLVIVSSSSMLSVHTNLLILNQCAVDFCACLVVLVMMCTYAREAGGQQHEDPGIRSTVRCLLWDSDLPFWSLVTCSTYNLVFVSVERYSVLTSGVSGVLFKVKVTQRSPGGNTSPSEPVNRDHYDLGRCETTSGTNTGISSGNTCTPGAWIIAWISRVSQMASRVSPMTSRVYPMASRVSPTASRVSPLPSRVSPTRVTPSTSVETSSPVMSSDGRNYAYVIRIQKFLVTRKGVFTLIASSWIIGPAIQIGLLLPTTKVVDGECIDWDVFTFNWQRRVFGAAEFSSTFLVPGAVFVVCYANIYRMLYMCRPDSNSNPEILRKTRSRRDVTKTLLAVVVSYFVCNSVRSICYLIYNLGEKKVFPVLFWQLATIATFANCSVNPILYTLQYQAYRHQLKKVLSQIALYLERAVLFVCYRRAG